MHKFTHAGFIIIFNMVIVCNYSRLNLILQSGHYVYGIAESNRMLQGPPIQVVGMA